MEILAEITWTDMCKWFEQTHPEDHADTAGNPSGCWFGGEYVFSKFGLPFDESSLSETYPTEVTADWFETDVKTNGWIHCYAENNHEFHHFSLFIDLAANKVIVLQTYGGLKFVIKLHRVWSEWCDAVKRAETGDSAAWRFLFNIPYKYKLVSNVGPTKFRILSQL